MSKYKVYNDMNNYVGYFEADKVTRNGEGLDFDNGLTILTGELFDNNTYIIGEGNNLQPIKGTHLSLAQDSIFIYDYKELVAVVPQSTIVCKKQQI